MMRRRISFILLSAIHAFAWMPVAAQPSCHHVHYSVEDGLPQNIIMNIIQDKRGFIWVATWNGLCKFDGYEFVAYLSDPYDGYYIRNNRIDQILEDKYGYIWAQSYDGVAHRFDPRTETFTGIRTVPGYEHLSFHVSRIGLMPSGKMWLTTEQSGCICVIDSTLKTELYHTENKRLKSNKVFFIYEDRQSRTWILTDNGIGMLECDATNPAMFFAEDNPSRKTRQSFYSMAETDTEIWFGSNNGRMWRYSKADGQFTLFGLPITSDIIQLRHNDGKIFIATSGHGLYVHDPATDKTVAYNTPASGLPDNRIYSIAPDHRHNIWIATGRTGVSKLDIRTGRIKHFDTKTEDPNEYFHPGMFVLEDSAKNIWVHPRGGGFAYYDPDKDVLAPMYDQPSADSRFSGVLHAAFCDRQGNLWLSSRSHGLEKVIFDNNRVQLTQFNYTDFSVGNDVRAVFEDADNNLWISTKDGSVRVFDAKRNLKGYLCQDGTIGHGKYIKGIIYCMYQDRDRNIWLGTKGDGLYRLQPLTAGAYKITEYQNDPNNIYSLSNNNVYSILQDSKGHIWVGTYGGGLNLAEQNGDGDIRFIHHRNRLTGFPVDASSRVRCIGEDRSGKICVGTTVGLVMFDSDFVLPENIHYRYYAHTESSNGSLSNNDIQGICNTAAGDMYLATFGGGLNKVETRDNRGFPEKFKTYTRKAGLPSNVTLSVVDASDSALWVSMETGLSKFDPEKEIFETFGEIGRLIDGGIFSEGSSVRLRSGEMIFGFSKGILSFSPQQIANNAYIPSLEFTEFRLFNKETDIGEGSPLHCHIDYIDKLTLTHRQNFFSIEFSALDLRDPGNILYAYKLEGFDNDWVYSQKQRIANYTNMPKGEYLFRVKSTNSDGVWVDNERQLPVVMLPSFWETPLAYALYCFVFILLLIAGAYILHTIYKLKHKMELETQLSEMKIRFFTDISHEIRTPLTMITAPVDYLMNDEKTPPEVKKQLDFVSRNTRRMLRMVNQVLDLRKIQNSKLKVEEIRMTPFIENICKSFDELAEKRRIDFRFVNNADGVTIWADHDCMEKMLFNLLSNAFKYTPDGKSITVTVDRNNQSVIVSVKDEGKGMTKDEQSRIFTRFASFNDDKSKPSTGIGLSLVKELVDKHHATISMESVPEIGSCFTIEFQKGYAHFGKNINLIVPEHFENAEDIAENVENAVESKEQEPGDIADTHKRPSILVVEDDDQLRLFLKTILESDYKVYEARDGEAGLKKALETIPDFIVSDVMMPRKDGLQLLQQLKTTLNTSHIPVVLLTARAAIESKLEGLTYGADDYITKPFSVPYFRARIENLLQQRKRLQQLYCSNLFAGPSVYTPDRPHIASQDDELMNKVMREIEANMDNNEYSVETLAGAIGVSRTILFKKIKGLTGLTPVEFIRDIKLQRAAQLLSTRQLSVKEVVYMIGMTDAKYFRQCFKKRYGKSPSEYMVHE